MTSLIEVEGELVAIDTALADLRPGDLLVLGVERIEESLAHVQARFSIDEAVATPSPLVGEGRGGGGRSHCRRRPPTPTLPHKGGGNKYQEPLSINGQNSPQPRSRAECRP